VAGPRRDLGLDLARPRRRRLGGGLAARALRLAALAIENANLYESLKNSYDGVMDVLWGSSLQYSDSR